MISISISFSSNLFTALCNVLGRFSAGTQLVQVKFHKRCTSGHVATASYCYYYYLSLLYREVYKYGIIIMKELLFSSSKKRQFSF